MAVATISPTGSISSKVGDVGVSVNPFKQTAGISARPSNDVSVGVGVGLGGVGANIGVDVVEAPDFGLSVGAGISSSGVSLGPTIIAGGSKEAKAGGQIGAGVGGTVGSMFGPIGTIVGTTVGSTLGSLAGTAMSRGDRGHHNRGTVRRNLWGLHIWDKKGNFLLQDGTMANFFTDGQEGIHFWKDSSKRTKEHQGRGELYAYDIDYTNDMDYVSGMTGISLSRLLNGGKNTEIDQLGGLFGNQLLGKVGYGAEMSEGNFKSVMGNARGLYAKAGISSKEELLSLGSQALAEGRVNDADYAVIQQVGDMVFDDNYDLAQQLMNGRGSGIVAAAKTPKEKGGAQGVVSYEEAVAGLAPYFSRGA